MENTSATKLGFYFCLGLFAFASFSGCGDDNAPLAHGASHVPAALQADLQAILDDAVAHETTPGVVLQIAQGDDSWSSAAGVDNLEKNSAMTPDERLRAGSIVKTFVATAVLQAEENGSLKLSDVLTDRLTPAVTARIENAATIDIEMLLDHRSGIAEWVTDEVEQAAVSDPEHVWTLDEILAQVENQPAAFQPGERWGYSNTNYILLGEILASVTGRSWRDVVRDQVIARAGLDHTTLPDVGDMECPACAHGYVSVAEELVDLTRVDPSMAGASGGHALITTSADLTRFMQSLRGGALFERPGTLSSMFAFQPALDPQTRTVGSGFGVMQMESNGYTAIGNLGGTAGYRSFMLYVPATDRYVSGFINVMGDLGAVLEPVLARVATP
jgi:D-alanyl-D-alanine carboxypeptidase